MLSQIIQQSCSVGCSCILLHIAVSWVPHAAVHTVAEQAMGCLQPELALMSLRKVLGLEPDHQEALDELREVQQLAIEERKKIAEGQQHNE